jgi:hypothetical protein
MKIIRAVLRCFIQMLIKNQIKRSKFLNLKMRSIRKWLRYIRANLLFIRSRNRLPKRSQKAGLLTKKFLENSNPASASANLIISVAAKLKASIPTKILKKLPLLLKKALTNLFNHPCYLINKRHQMKKWCQGYPKEWLKNFISQAQTTERRWRNAPKRGGRLSLE